MIWTSSPLWAPFIVATLQSRPPLLMEIVALSMVAIILCWALVTNTTTLVTTLTSNAGELAGPLCHFDAPKRDADDVLDKMSNIAKTGDGGSTSIRREIPICWDGSAHLSNTSILYVSCAACQLSQNKQTDDFPQSPANELGLVSEDPGKDSGLIRVSSTSRGEVHDEDVLRHVQKLEEEDRRQEFEDIDLFSRLDDYDMIEYVTARYQTLREAAMAGQFLVADPFTSMIPDMDLFDTLQCSQAQ